MVEVHLDGDQIVLGPVIVSLVEVVDEGLVEDRLVGDEVVESGSY